MGVPLRQKMKVARYVIGQRLRGNRCYPLVLMLEPLFKCNLACAGCGKIDYPAEELDRRLSVEECLEAVDECGAPIVSIPGGEPLLHPEIAQIVSGITERKRYVYLCTNGLLIKKRIDEFTPSRYLTFSIHLDGLRARHDQIACRNGVFDIASDAIRLVKSRGFRITVNCTLFDDADPDEVAEFLDYVTDLRVEGVMISPGFNYERAPRQDFFLKRERSKHLFREIFRRRKGRGWDFNQSSLFLDFLSGNQSYQCTPWGSPTRNIFGWQKPCYLLVGEGSASSFSALIEETDWDQYGLGKNEKCGECQVHCGFEPTAVNDAIAHPLKALWVAVRGPRTKGRFARDLTEA